MLLKCSPSLIVGCILFRLLYLYVLGADKGLKPVPKMVKSTDSQIFIPMEWIYRKGFIVLRVVTSAASPLLSPLTLSANF